MSCRSGFPVEASPLNDHVDVINSLPNQAPGLRARPKGQWPWEPIDSPESSPIAPGGQLFDREREARIELTNLASPRMRKRSLAARTSADAPTRGRQQVAGTHPLVDEQLAERKDKLRLAFIGLAENDAAGAIRRAPLEHRLGQCPQILPIGRAQAFRDQPPQTPATFKVAPAAGQPLRRHRKVALTQPGQLSFRDRQRGKTLLEPAEQLVGLGSTRIHTQQGP